MDIGDEASRHESLERAIRLQERSGHFQETPQRDIDTPQYCDMCGDEIPKRRLKAVPWTTHCVRCQTLLEMKR